MKLFMLVLFIIKILVESKLLKAEGRGTRDQIADHPLDQRERNSGKPCTFASLPH